MDVEDWEIEYRRRTPRSRDLFERSARLHVNGVSHNIRFFEPYPFVTISSHGSSLTDVDSNCYTDYWMGHWSLILGHLYPDVEAALYEQVSHGWMYGTVNSQTIALSQLISDAVPVAERIRYSASGTESVMYAIRLARAVTGRDIIAKIDGGWHGYATDILKTVNWPFTKPESAGIQDEHIVSIPYNDIESATSILDAIGDKLAGVVVEPMLGGAGGIPADVDYMRALQECTHQHGALLIIDEIVTGFRFGYGCAYAEMGLDPDLLTLGKVVGGGMPMGALCGQADIMELANDRTMSRDKRCYIGGGTFSANPASMVAGSATLRVLKESPAIYDGINQAGEDVRASLARVLDGKAQITGKGSIFMVHFTELGPVTDAATAAACDAHALHDYHMRLMTDGIFFLPGKMGSISSAHTDADIKQLVDATERFAVYSASPELSPASPELSPAVSVSDRAQLAREAIAKFRSMT